MTILRFLLALLFPSILKWWEGRQQAKQLATVTQEAVTAEAKDAQAEQIIHAQEVRSEVDAEVEKLPESGAGKVADDPAGSAGRELHDHWQRD